MLTFNILDCLEAVPVVRKAAPAARICFGGFHPSIYPNETIDLPAVDVIVFGEGEITFAEYVRAIAEGDEGPARLGFIYGLGWKDADGRPVLNPPRPAATRTAYDSFPMPAHDLLDIEKYSVVMSDADKTASIQTSRGCPGKCVFCDIRMTQYRYRSASRILEEIKFLHGLGVREFFVLDDTFTANKKRVKELCAALAEADLGIKFKISARIDTVDAEILESLAKAGCYRIHYGVETGSQRLLDYLEKGITLDQVRAAFRLTREAGIEPLAYMMLGVPTETEDEVWQSIRFVEEIEPYHVSWSVCTPFPKTRLYEMQLAATGMTDYWGEFARAPYPDFKIRTMNENMSGERLRQLQSQALRHFYASPRRILRELARTGSFRQLLRKAKVGMTILSGR